MIKLEFLIFNIDNQQEDIVSHQITDLKPVVLERVADSFQVDKSLVRIDTEQMNMEGMGKMVIIDLGWNNAQFEGIAPDSSMPASAAAAVSDAVEDGDDRGQQIPASGD